MINLEWFEQVELINTDIIQTFSSTNSPIGTYRIGNFGGSYILNFDMREEGKTRIGEYSTLEDAKEAAQKNINQYDINKSGF